MNKRSFTPEQGQIPKPRSKARTAIFCLLSVCSGLAAGLLAAEVILRVLNIDPADVGAKYVLSNGSRLYWCYTDNPNDELTDVPDVSTGDWKFALMFGPEEPLENRSKAPWCVERQQSSIGLRDREYEPNPPAGKLRILGSGDSFAAGEGVPLQLSLFKKMESLLGPDYEVVNAAFPGANLLSDLDKTTRFSSKLNAKRAIVVVIPNDIDLPPGLKAQGEELDIINLRSLKSRYARWPRIVQVPIAAYWRWRGSRQTLQWYLDAHDPKRNARGLRRMEKVFELLAGIPDTRVVLVIYPLMEGFPDKYPLLPVHHTIAGLAMNAGLPVFDLVPAFARAGYDASELQVHPVDHHPNSKAHEIAARAIVDWLRREQPGFLELDERVLPSDKTVPQ